MTTTCEYEKRVHKHTYFMTNTLSCKTLNHTNKLGSSLHHVLSYRGLYKQSKQILKYDWLEWHVVVKLNYWKTIKWPASLVN